MERQLKVEPRSMRRRVRDCVRRLLLGEIAELRDVASMLRRLIAEGSSPLLLGGLLRDSALYGSRVQVRDIDLVVGGEISDEMAVWLASHSTRRTRFGGYSLKLGACRVDVWRLKDTWALRTGRVRAPSVEGLLRSTFFNIEAMVARPHLDRSGKWTVSLHDGGALSALSSRQLDTNLVDNPFPELCVLRAYLLCRRHSLRLGGRLKQYVIEVAPAIGPDRYEALQLGHYGLARAEFDSFLRWQATLANSQDDSLQLERHAASSETGGGGPALLHQLELLALQG